MGHAILFLFHSIVMLTRWIVIIWALLSWLIAFDVINTRNPTVYRLVRALDGVCSPLMAPIRRFMPNLGGVDLSPIIFLLLLTALEIAVDNTLAAPLIQLLG